MRSLRILIGGMAAVFWIASLGFAQTPQLDATSPFLSADYSKKISMDFKGASLEDILKIFSQQTGLNLITAESVSGKKVTVFLDQVPVEQALEQLLRANNLTYEIQPGSNIFVVKPLAQKETELITRVYQLKHATVSNAQIQHTLKIEDVALVEGNGITDTIKSLLTSKGKFVEDSRTNSLIISDIASNFPNIENAIAKLDVPVCQILIEVEMLEVTKGTTDKIGTKFGETPFAFQGGTKDNLFPFKTPSGFFSAGAQYTAGIVDFSGMTAIVQFLRTQTGTKTLARPQILTLNNQAAEIKISTNEAVSATATSIAAGAGGLSSSSTTVERAKTGIFLTVTPQANLLTGEITMAVMPKVINVVASDITTKDSTIVKDPEERSTKALLRVQSGDTIIIGGLIRQNRSNTVTKVPFLSEIPGIGPVFRHRNETVSDTELIVFLTPHIINETPVPQINGANIHQLDREQDSLELPTKKLSSVDSKKATTLNTQKTK